MKKFKLSELIKWCPKLVEGLVRSHHNKNGCEPDCPYCQMEMLMLDTNLAREIYCLISEVLKDAR